MACPSLGELTQCVPLSLQCYVREWLACKILICTSQHVNIDIKYSDNKNYDRKLKLRSGEEIPKLAHRPWTSVEEVELLRAVWRRDNGACCMLCHNALAYHILSDACMCGPGEAFWPRQLGCSSTRAPLSRAKQKIAGRKVPVRTFTRRSGLTHTP